MNAIPLPDSYDSIEEYRHENRMWWHESVAKELRRLRDTCGTPAYNVAGIAGNVGLPIKDVAFYIQQMLLWGELASTPPLWSYAPETWVALTASDAAIPPAMTERIGTQILAQIEATS